MDSDAFINPRYGSTIEMGGRPAPMPPRPSRHGADPEIRMLATRSRSLSDTMARERQESRPQTVRELVQVYDGGNLPTQANLVYWTHPVEIDAEDVEGATPSFTPDASQTIPVVFIRGTPNPGDKAVAHAIAGRWVAEIGGTPGCGCNACDPGAKYQLPNANLTLNFSPPLFNGRPYQMSSTTLYVAGKKWTTNDLSLYGIIFELDCGSGDAKPTFSWSLTTGDPTVHPADFVSYDPSTQVVFHEGLDGTFLQDYTYTITGVPPGNSNDYCVNVCLSFCGVPYSGATISILNPSGKAVATGKTGVNGCVLLDIGQPGTYTVKATIQGESGTKTVYQQSQTLKCIPQNIDINCGSCDWATVLPTIHVTDSSQTVACAWNGFQWRGCYKLSLGSAYDSCSCWSDVTDPGAGECLIVYIITCQAVGGCVFNVQRQWYVCGAGGKAGYCADNIGDFGNGCGPVPSNCGGEEHTCTGFGFDVANAAVVDPCDADWPVSVDLDLGQIGLTGVTLDSPLGAKVTLQP